MEKKLLFDSALFPLQMTQLFLTQKEDFPVMGFSRPSFIYVHRGSISISFPSSRLPLHSSGAIYIARNRKCSVHADSDCELTLISFDEELFAQGSLVSQKYLIPLARLGSDYSVLSKRGATGLEKMIDSIDEAAFGWELKALAGLLEVLGIICYENQSRLSEKEDCQDPRLRRMLDYMKNHIGERLCLEDIAKEGCVSVREASRLFEKELGSSVMKHFLFMRLEKAKALLEKGELNVSEICQASGFESVSHFSTCFRRVYAMSPSQFRRKGSS